MSIPRQKQEEDIELKVAKPVRKAKAAVTATASPIRKAKAARLEGKTNISVVLPRGVAETLRDLVFFSPGLSISEAINEALTPFIAARAKKFKNGIIPSRGSLKLKQGRPIR